MRFSVWSQNSPTYKLDPEVTLTLNEGKWNGAAFIRKQWCWHLPRFACTQLSDQVSASCIKLCVIQNQNGPKYKLKITAFDPKVVFSDNSLYYGSPPWSLICLSNECFPNIHLDQLSPAPNRFFYFGTARSPSPRAQRRTRLGPGAPFPGWPCRSNQWSTSVWTGKLVSVALWRSLQKFKIALCCSVRTSAMSWKVLFTLY